MKTSMREMKARQARPAGKPAGTRNPNIRSPYQERGKSRAWRDETHVEGAAVVVNPADLERLAAMQANRPLKPPPTKFETPTYSAGAVAARRDRNGIA